MKTLTLGAAALLLGATTAQAEYPERPIEITVPAPAGGGTDTSARMLATLLEGELGTSIAILNAAGGGGSVGVTQFMQARNDGYSLLATWNSPITTVPQMQPTAYAPDSFVPVASTSQTAYTLCVAPAFPAETGEEFLAELAANPKAEFCYTDDGHNQVRITAAAEVLHDADLKRKIWEANPLLRAYLQDISNPELIIYKFTPRRVRYMKEWALEYHEVPLD